MFADNNAYCVKEIWNQRSRQLLSEDRRWIVSVSGQLTVEVRCLEVANVAEALIVARSITSVNSS